MCGSFLLVLKPITCLGAGIYVISATPPSILLDQDKSSDVAAGKELCLILFII